MDMATYGGGVLSCNCTFPGMGATEGELSVADSSALHGSCDGLVLVLLLASLSLDCLLLRGSGDVGGRIGGGV